MDSSVLLLFTLAFSIPAISCLILTPLVRRIAFAWKAIDYPDTRKVHTRPTPRLGGLAVFSSCVITLLILGYSSPSQFSLLWIAHGEGLALACSLMVMLGLGTWDDIHPLSPNRKMIVQLLMSVVVCMAGFSFSGAGSPEGALAHTVGNYVSSILWIMAVTNAVNLIDGLDGLAPGICIIASLAFALLAILGGDTGTALLALVLAGALLGFLRFNFNPARIFLGDSGSLFVGFLMATLSFKCMQCSPGELSTVSPALAIGLPLLDTTLSVIRRFLQPPGLARPESNGLNGRLKRVLVPDKNHIHHKLIARGLSQRRAVIVLYASSCGMSIGALVLALVSPGKEWLVVFGLLTAVLFGIRKLDYTELAIIRNGLLLRLCEYIFSRRWAILCVDGALIVVSYVASAVLTSAPEMIAISGQFIETLGLVAVIQLLAFGAFGFYRSIVRTFELEDVARILIEVVMAVAATGILLLLAPRPIVVPGRALLIADSFLLFTGVFVSRSSRGLLHRSTPPPGTKKIGSFTMAESST